MHRNTLLFISLLAVVAALLFGFNVGRRFVQPVTDNPQPTTQTTPLSTPKTMLTTYTNSLCGISFQYPESLTKLEATAGAMFVDAQNASASVALACQADIPRVPLPPDRIEEVVIESTSGTTVSAMLYHDASEKDGTPIDRLIFTHPTNGLDVFIAGLGTAFQTIISSLKIL